jgi:hypothetical protein
MPIRCVRKSKEIKCQQETVFNPPIRKSDIGTLNGLSCISNNENGPSGHVHHARWLYMPPAALIDAEENSVASSRLLALEMISAPCCLLSLGSKSTTRFIYNNPIYCIEPQEQSSNVLHSLLDFLTLTHCHYSTRLDGLTPFDFLENKERNRADPRERRLLRTGSDSFFL